MDVATDEPLDDEGGRGAAYGAALDVAVKAICQIANRRISLTLGRIF